MANRDTHVGSLQSKTALEVKPLRFAYSRLNSLLRTLEVTKLDDYNPLQVLFPSWGVHARGSDSRSRSSLG